MNNQLQIPNQVREEFNQYLTDKLFADSPKGLYEPVNYLLSLGGKRLRPVVLLLSSYVFSGNYRQALPAALAIEVFHNFTLVHDDVMDDAPLRRGESTVHEKYGLNTSILSGDVMMVHAFNFLLELEEKEKLDKVLRVFTKQAIEVCEGQQMDMNFEQMEDVPIPDYIKMIELKTSVLVGAAMQIGALLGGATYSQAESIYQFGRNLGIAFQLQDDYLDTYGDPSKFGKKTGGDIIQKKKTILYLKALEMADEGKGDALKKLYNADMQQEDEKVQRVVAMFDELGVKGLVRELQEQYQTEAFNHLERLGIKQERKAMIRAFAEELLNRQL